MNTVSSSRARLKRHVKIYSFQKTTSPHRNHQSYQKKRIHARCLRNNLKLSFRRMTSTPLKSEQDIGEVEIVKTPTTVQRFNPLSQWDALATRHKLLFVTGVAFVLCNMDKVNMSVAIIPMAREFGWSATVSGLVQSSFFYGYALCQLPGGFLNTKFSGARMLPIGVGFWSLATAGVPLLRGSVIGLCASRAVVGMGEALAPASLTDMVSAIVPVTERSRAMSFVGSALYLGSLIGLLLSPIIVEHYNWPAVFYIFGGLGLVWTLWWALLLRCIAQTDPLTYSELIGHKKKDHLQHEIPWRAMLRCRPLRALIYTHFCNNWFHFAIMAWLPSYFTDTLSLDLTHAAQISLLPPIAGILASLIAGPIADYLISKGWRVGVVRKLAQCTAFFGPSICLVLASCPPLASWTIFLLTAALGLSGFSLAGLYCNHQDLSNTYSSVLLGITNTAGALPGILGVAATGALLDRTQSWPVALFAPSIFFFVTGSMVFTLYGSGEEASFDNNEPFAIEKALKGILTSFNRNS
eukprot:g7002.t1